MGLGLSRSSSVEGALTLACPLESTEAHLDDKDKAPASTELVVALLAAQFILRLSIAVVQLNQM